MVDDPNKIYVDNRNVPYKETRIKALETKSEIEAVFAKFGVKDTTWHWDPEGSEVYVTFDIFENIDGQTILVKGKVDAPVIWRHKSNNGPERIDWNVSLRTMYWYIKTHLESAFLWGSSRVAMFLPNLTNDRGDTFEKVFVPQLAKSNFAALPLKEP